MQFALPRIFFLAFLIFKDILYENVFFASGTKQLKLDPTIYESLQKPIYQPKPQFGRVVVSTSALEISLFTS